MPSGTCFDLNTTLASEYNGQNEICYADLNGIPAHHTFARSTWATWGLQRPGIKSVRWEYHIAMMLNLSVTVMQPLVPVMFSFSVFRLQFCWMLLCFFQGTSDIQWGHPVKNTRWEIWEAVDIKLGRTNLRMLMGGHTYKPVQEVSFFFYSGLAFHKRKKIWIKKCYNTFLVSTHTVLCDIYSYDYSCTVFFFLFILVLKYHFSANQHGCHRCVEKGRP